MRKALFQHVENGKVVCTLCPHDCRVSPGGRGACGVRINRDGVLYTLVADRVVAEDVDPIEKKPFFHFLPGSLAYSIATAGCNLRCRFCQNWQISQGPKDKTKHSLQDEIICPDLEELPIERSLGHRITPAGVVAAAKESRSDTIAYTYTEPTIFFELALDCARVAREAGLRNVFVTNGFIAPEAQHVIAPLLDAANVDLKSFRDSYYRRVCGARLEPVLDAIREYHRAGVWLEITTLVVPGHNDSDDELTDIARFIHDELGPDVPWHLSRFFPAWRMMYVPPTDIERLTKAKDIGREAGLRYVYVGNVADFSLSHTYCRECGELVVERAGLRCTKNTLRDGSCPRCGVRVAGVW